MISCISLLPTFGPRHPLPEGANLQVGHWKKIPIIATNISAISITFPFIVYSFMKDKDVWGHGHVPSNDNCSICLLLRVVRAAFSCIDTEIPSEVGGVKNAMAANL